MSISVLIQATDRERMIKLPYLKLVNVPYAFEDKITCVALLTVGARASVSVYSLRRDPDYSAGVVLLTSTRWRHLVAVLAAESVWAAAAPAVPGVLVAPVTAGERQFGGTVGCRETGGTGVTQGSQGSHGSQVAPNGCG